MSELNLCVLGAGVVGLTTALELQSEFRNATVTILADKFDKDTTSYIAAGLFLPSHSFMGPTVEITSKWITDAYNHWTDLSKTYGGPEVGIVDVSGYMYSSIDPAVVRNEYVEKLLPVFRQATKEELKLCGGDWKYGSYISSIVIENGIYLPWATKKFLNANGKIVSRKIDELSELAGKYDVVVNCTGLNARFLCHDVKVIPVRGQVYRVRAPWINKFYLTDWDTYVIPNVKGVTLEGTRQFESFNLDWNQNDGMDIKRRCEALLPSLKDSEVLEKLVGLRPFRSPVRVEPELFNVYESRVKVVHNYGHGGYGVTTAPGTSKHAVKLVREILMTNSKL